MSVMLLSSFLNQLLTICLSLGAGSDLPGGVGPDGGGGQGPLLGDAGTCSG
jgi:hypothetical protein